MTFAPDAYRRAKARRRRHHTRAIRLARTPRPPADPDGYRPPTRYSRAILQGLHHGRHIYPGGAPGADPKARKTARRSRKANR